jgi:ubiquinone/menaquinone biosynthesis C-methylase UbiE
MTTLPASSPVANPYTVHSKAAWMAGDYGKIAQGYALGAVEFANRLHLSAGDRVLDVGCGTGNLAIPVARTGAHVSAIDLAPKLIGQAMQRAHAERLTIRFKEGNVEAMPYATGSFDVVVTLFGAALSSQPDAAAAELARVCRSGGRMAMANWTPNGFVGQMFQIVAKYIPPTPDVPSPFLWGVETTVAERLGQYVAELRCTLRTITFSYPFDVATTVEYLSTYYGPTAHAYAALGRETKRQLHSDLEALWSHYNCREDGITEVDSTYLEVIAVRK